MAFLISLFKVNDWLTTIKFKYLGPYHLLQSTWSCLGTSRNKMSSYQCSLAESNLKCTLCVDPPSLIEGNWNNVLTSLLKVEAFQKMYVLALNLKPVPMQSNLTWNKTNRLEVYKCQTNLVKFLNTWRLSKNRFDAKSQKSKVIYDSLSSIASSELTHILRILNSLGKNLLA